MRLFAGTSGFSYPEWKGVFYPEDLPGGGMLAYYADRLPSVEINSTFYRMPRRAVLARWAADVPEGFRFVVKASRRITHVAKLKEVDELLSYLYGSLEELGDRLGCVFFQLPRWLRKDTALLAEFLDKQPEGRRVAMEFTHDSWFDEESAEVLRAHDAAYCMSDKEGGDPPNVPDTADWGYLRLRRADYEAAALGDWCRRLRERDWREAFVFFKHEDDCAGPRLAQRFLEVWAGGS